MLINTSPYRAIWLDTTEYKVKRIDQRKLPHEFNIVSSNTLQKSVVAIQSMYVRGAPSIGVTAAFGFYLAMQENRSDEGIDNAYKCPIAARPAAINLEWAYKRVAEKLRSLPQRAELTPRATWHLNWLMKMLQPTPALANLAWILFETLPIKNPAEAQFVS